MIAQAHILIDLSTFLIFIYFLYYTEGEKTERCGRQCRFQQSLVGAFVII